jgi:hypothetical protein
MSLGAWFEDAGNFWGTLEGTGALQWHLTEMEIFSFINAGRPGREKIKK